MLCPFGYLKRIIFFIIGIHIFDIIIYVCRLSEFFHRTFLYMGHFFLFRHLCMALVLEHVDLTLAANGPSADSRPEYGHIIP